MELGSYYLTVLFLHVVTAIVDKKSAVWKCHRHIKQINPVLGIVRVVGIPVLWENIGVFEIAITAVVALISATHMLKFDGIHKEVLFVMCALLG